ncbi:MAG: hypothetical protein ACRDYA_18555 [Egibacteraceae bacterium]
MNDENYEDIAPHQVLSAEEGAAIQRRIAERASAKQWHWMGNYGSVYDPVNVANGAGIAAGGLIINFSGGLVAAWMYY